jgi:hypothetical protein
LHGKGKNIDEILEEYEGYNSERILLYTPIKDWGSSAWSFPSNDLVVDCVRKLNDRGHYPLLTLCTDNNQNVIDKIKSLVNYLNNFDLYLLLEAVNEPFIKGDDDKISPDIFRNVLNNSKYLYSSGVYNDNRRFYGKFWLDHSSRDGEWYRKGGHNLYEAYVGGGPNFNEEPALKIACIEGEPIRPDQIGYNTLLIYTYYASCSLFGARAYFHSESGKHCVRLNSGEVDCKNAALKGLNVFPKDAPLAINTYRRIVEPGNEEGGDNQSGRTYVVGNYSIRIHQKGNQHPENGWKNLDDFGICYGR